MNEEFQPLGFFPADILLPRAADMTRWAVVACDQFTSQPEYWQAVEDTVGDAPSALRLILPEARLNEPDVDEKIRRINETMDAYLKGSVFRTLENTLLYIERTQSDGKIRRGLIGMVDLERYDYTPGSGALIRATEGTVLARIPPRVKVRREAPIELPHVMLLIDDPAGTVIEPLAEKKAEMEQIYAFPLMQGGGRVAGWRMTPGQMAGAAGALAALADPGETERKYGLPGAAPMLFAVGDGNHSLAAAKACYEELKQQTPQERWADLPARYALVEVVNNHDDALQFSPIHRCLFGVEPQAVLTALREYYQGAFEGRGPGHVIAYTAQGCSGTITVPNPRCQLAVGTLQEFLDAYLKDHGGTLDYIHGDDVADRLGSQPGNLAFKLPPMEKEQLFKTVMADGVLPRKTFSMGHAQDKRYYVEARRIR
ncbi:DUF1015 domain-containing protein [Dysosmobacter sp.]